jgi:tetraacyldisaccharide-1-P 4'-kinase
LIVVTSKVAYDDVVDRVHDRLATVAPLVPRVSVRIVLLDLVNAMDRTDVRRLSELGSARIGAVMSIGDPTSFIAQLRALGGRFDPRADVRVFPDHHAFTDREVAEVARDLRHVDVALCTLKDAVKLSARWPRLGPPLWYVSQDVQVERGVGGLDFVLDGVVRTRTPRTPSQIAG